MSEQELKEFLEAARRVREHYTATPELARQLLREEGVIDANGELTERYRPTR